MRAANAYIAMLVVSLVAVAAEADEPTGYPHPLLPRPISVEDLTRWSSHLDLSRAQQHALVGQYETYLDRYWALNQTEFIPSNLAFNRFRFDRRMLANAGEIRRLRADIARLDGVIAAMDDEFFAAIESIIAAAQAAHLDRCRNDRIRARCLVPATDFSARNRIHDIAPLVAALDLTPSERARLEEDLLSYEQSMTTLLQAVRKQVLDVHVNPAMIRGELDKEMWDRKQRAWREIVEQSVFDASAMTYRSFRTIRSKLPPEKGDQLAASFYVRGLYSLNAMLHPGDQERLIRAIDRSDAISAEQKNQIAEEYRQLQRTLLPVADEAAAIIATSFDQPWPGAEAAVRRDRRLWTETDPLRSQNRRLQNAFESRFYGLFGDQLVEQLEEGRLPDHRQGKRDLGWRDRVGPEVPLPLSNREFARIVFRVGFDDDDIARELHQAYVDRCDRVLGPMRAELSEVIQRADNSREDHIAQAPEGTTPMRRRLIERTIALDAEFFLALAEITPDDGMKTLDRLARLRERDALRTAHRRPDIVAYENYFHQFPAVDLIDLLVLGPGPIEHTQQVAETLDSYEVELMILLRQRVPVTLDLLEKSAELVAERRRGQAAEGVAFDRMAFAQRRDAALRDARGRMRDLNHAIARLNIDTIEQLASTAGARKREIIDRFHHVALPQLPRRSEALSVVATQSAFDPDAALGIIGEFEERDAELMAEIIQTSLTLPFGPSEVAGQMIGSAEHEAVRHQMWALMWRRSQLMKLAEKRLAILDRSG